MMKKKQKTGSRENTSKKNNKNAIYEQLTALMSKEPDKNFTLKEICHLLHLKNVNERQQVVTVLNELINEKVIEETRRGKYKYIFAGSYITGRVDLKMNGSAYIISDESEQDIYVGETNLHHALDDDEVKVFVFSRRKSDRLEGEVVEIIKRARTRFVGILEISGSYAYLITDFSHLPYDMFIPTDQLNGAKNGQKVIAEILEWPKKSKNPIGRIVEVLGTPGENDVEIHAILAEYGLPYRFPKQVEESAKKLKEGISTDEIKQRRDFRSIPTFTIDPADAKDFDDALSLQKLDNGHWEVGVHIADVSWYVTPNTPIDSEAAERGTSVYLVDRVVPMLPEKLSNHICSLNPNEDKLCYSVVFEMDNDAKVLDKWFGRTIINSNKRFDYDQAQSIIETGQGEMAYEITTLDKLAKKLRTQRFKAGSIDFERSEVKFRLDEKGKPLGVIFKENKDSNKLIEEFMLLANRSVAELIGKPAQNMRPKTFVYRVHDEPNPEKLGNFARFVKKFGYQIQTGSRKNITSSINKLLDQVAGKNEQNLVETLAIRSMAKAEYTTQNIGHYGLAFDYYTHFTSPIRRYPDMMVHRLLQHYLKGGKSVDADHFEQLCKHASDMEQKAASAERASVKYKQVEFLADKIGQVFDGVISGVTQWGIYVEIIENKCEGMIPLRDLTGDYYIFDEDNYCITGYRSKRTFQLGDKIKIKIKKANLEKKQLDFSWVRE